MKKIICKKVYDTETSTLVKKVTFGYFGDSEGYEECLYKTEGGFYFLYVNGGANSKHPKVILTITEISFHAFCICPPITYQS